VNLLQLARYPFLPEAVELIREREITLEDLLSLDIPRRAGYERVLEALENGFIEEHPVQREEEAYTELLSYPVGRMLVSCIGDNYLVRRYAVAESKLASRRFMGEDIDFLCKVAAHYDMEVQVNGDISVPFPQYLTATNRMRAKEWKLVNQPLKDGRILLNRRKLIRVLQELIRKRLEEELPLPVNTEILQTFREEAGAIASLLKEKKRRYEGDTIAQVSITLLPPCMQHLLAMIQKGENVPHMGRFALTAFLHNTGLDSEEIFRIYSTFPDFDERMTRYQIDHITGVISGTEYTPPECSTMMSYGICHNPDGLCAQEWMNHPLTYYRTKSRGARASARSSAPSAKR
jgi:DNA primase large subunit